MTIETYESLENDPTSRLSKEYVRQKGEINRLYRGHARKARLLIAELSYGLGLIEGDLGGDDVRDKWRTYIDRLATCTQTAEMTVRRNVLVTVNWAAKCYLEPGLASKWKNPRRTERSFFATDRNGVDVYLISAWPNEREAADAGLAFLTGFDPELAARLDAAEIASLVPTWIARKTNVGRRGKKEQIDALFCALFTRLGHGKIEPEAMRRYRLAFERTHTCWPRPDRQGKSTSPR